MYKHPGKKTSPRKKSHEPSQYRAFVREAKNPKGKNIKVLLKEARMMDDPYYCSLTLAKLSNIPSLNFDLAITEAENALEFAEQEPRGWRQAELICELAKQFSHWREESRNERVDEIRGRLLGKIVENIGSIPQGKARSDAIQGTATRFGGKQLEHLLELALGNTGFEFDDSRSVIRTWAKHSGKIRKKFTPKQMVGLLQHVDETLLGTKLLGYLNLQMNKAKIEINGITPFPLALEGIDSISEQEDRMAALRYLSGIAQKKDEFIVMREKVEDIGTRYTGIRLLSTLAGQADKHGYPELAKEWFFQALSLAEELEEPEKRASIRQNIAEGIARCGLKTEAKEVFTNALEDIVNLPIPEKRKLMTRRIIRSMEKLGLGIENISTESPEKMSTEERNKDGIEGSNEKIVEERNKDGIEGSNEKIAEERNKGIVKDLVEERSEKNNEGSEKSTSDIMRKNRHTLALYDTYEGGLKPVHFRAIARAAPMCVAFDLDLALVGFPTNDLSALVKQTKTETNIGKGGEYLRQLVGEGRVRLVHASPRESPKDWDGVPVATTSHPDMEKRCSMDSLLSLLSKNGGRLCLIMGLGRKGLPATLLKSTEYHLELTGGNVPLETCTAMGIIAERLRSLYDRMEK